MKALKSDLARRILARCFDDKEFALKVKAGLPFEFEGVLYRADKYPTR